MIIFPDNFELIADLIPNEETGLRPKLFASYDNSAVSQVVGDTRGEFQEIEIQLNSKPLKIAMRGFHLYNPPKQSNSEDSEATYYARSDNKHNGLILQKLESHSRTSAHYHKQQKELYCLVAGEVTIHAKGVDALLNAPGKSQATVFPGSPDLIHPLETEDSASLTILQLKNCPKGLSMEDHFYVEV